MPWTLDTSLGPGSGRNEAVARASRGSLDSFSRELGRAGPPASLEPPPENSHRDEDLGAEPEPPAHCTEAVVLPQNPRQGRCAEPGGDYADDRRIADVASA